MGKKKLHIVYLGINGFPYLGSAPINAALWLCKGLVDDGSDVTVINRKGVLKKNAFQQIPIKGSYKGVKYIYTANISYRPAKFIKRNYYKLKGLANEIKYLLIFSRKSTLDYGILSSQYFTSILFYRILSKILNFSLIYHYVEYRTAMKTNRSLKFKIETFLIDKFGIKLFDGILPISDFLIDNIKKHTVNMPILKIPVLFDFNINSRVRGNTGSEKKYFLFCGTAGRLEIIEFILKSFDRMNFKDVYLYLICNGNSRQMINFEELVENYNAERLIEVFSNLSYQELIKLYENAIGLLIPLRPTIEDAARMPFKIGEYLSSGNPIITCNYGEAKKYFVDGVNALVTNQYDTQEFANKMNYIVTNPEKGKEIGLSGKKVGIMNFFYKKHGVILKDFLIELADKKSNWKIEQ